MYKSFGEDRSSFGFLTYAEAKNRKDVLNRSFSQAAIDAAEDLIVDQTKALCAAFAKHSKASKSADLHFAYRCMSMDIICTFCFGKPINAVDAPDFEAPIVMAMDASMPVFIRFKYSDLFKNMIMKCPPKLSKIISPSTAGLVDLQQVHRLCSLSISYFDRESLTIPSSYYGRLMISPTTQKSSNNFPIA